MLGRHGPGHHHIAVEFSCLCPVCAEPLKMAAKSRSAYPEAVLSEGGPQRGMPGPTATVSPVYISLQRLLIWLAVAEGPAFLLGIVVFVVRTIHAVPTHTASGKESESQLAHTWDTCVILHLIANLIGLFLGCLFVTACRSHRNEEGVKHIKTWIITSDIILVIALMFQIVNCLVIDTSSVLVLAMTAIGASLISLICWTIMFFKLRNHRALLMAVHSEAYVSEAKDTEKVMRVLTRYRLSPVGSLALYVSDTRSRGEVRWIRRVSTGRALCVV